MQLIKPEKIKYLVVHESASRWGDAAEITTWHQHREPPFETIGYHAVILNGYRTSAMKYDANIDGKIEPGRSEKYQGAHCAGQDMNTKSLGVCMVGIPGHDKYPTANQWKSLIHWCATKCTQYNIDSANIGQHSMYEPDKPCCASIDIKKLRNDVHNEILKLKQ